LLDADLLYTDGKEKEMDSDLIGLRMEGGYIKGNN
jgi:hypothetical protein